MNISYNWLKNYLPTLEKVDIKELTNKISGALAEVEQIIEKGKGLENIVVGEIIEVREHPNSNKHMLAKVNTGDKERQIIFAGANKQYVQPGMLYPVCLPEGKIYDSKDPIGTQGVKEIVLREFEGEVSEGILCSPKELGISDEEKGVSIIGNDMKAGDDLEYLLKDFVFEIENKSLTHRPDCFSHRGIAREIAAIMRIEFMEKAVSSNPIKTGNLPFDVKIKEKDLCNRFTGIVLQDINVKPSPAWMQINLAYVGVRPINNIVDISNFIMHDIGYPTHMYDYDKIAGNELIVRKAQEKEKVNALNEKTYTLDTTMMVVADKENVEDVAGIMGGANSEISENTKNVIVESASWDMFNIRRTSMTLGLNSEASLRYSKGLDSFGTKETVNRAIMYIEDLAGGEIASDLIDIVNDPYEEKYVEFDLSNVKRLLGVEISKDEIMSILESLKIVVEGKENNPTNQISSGYKYKLKIPTFRKDLNISQDIVEEVARIYGYENVEPKLPETSIKPAKINPDTQLIRSLRKTLNESGMDEVYSYSFVGKELYEKANLDPKTILKLKNPLSPELESFRNQILPSLISKIETNINNYDELSFFEISKIVIKTKGEELPDQPRLISGLFVSKNNTNESFNELKKKLDYLFTKFALKVRYENLNGDILTPIAEAFHPNKTAKIFIEDKFVGYVGEVHPIIKINYDYKNLDISLFDLDYEVLKELIQKTKFEYNQIISTQLVTRDISIWLDEKTEIGSLISTINNHDIDYLLSTHVIDTYSDKTGKRSSTLRFTLQDYEKTLNEKDINATIDRIIEIISNELGLELRK